MSDPVHDYLVEIGRKGGAAGRGPAKARTSEQARAAAHARWTRTKARANQQGERPSTRSGGVDDRSNASAG